MTQPHLHQLSASEWLRGRRLVTISDEEVTSLSLLAHGQTQAVPLDGVILTGANAAARARDLRATYAGVTVLVEPSSTAKALASTDAPFVLPTGGLFDPSLAELIFDQLANCDGYVLAPTAYLGITEPGALRAAIQQANQLDTDRLIVPVPLDSAWLKSAYREQLIAVLNESRHPLLLSLGSDGEPLGTKDKSEGLVALLKGVPTLSFTRADQLVGMEVLARTDGAVAFGTIPSRRRTTPPGKKGFSSDKTERRPHLYYPSLHRFIRGKVARELFANTPPPHCDNPCHGGRPLEAMPDTAHDHIAAMNHNVASLLIKATGITGSDGERMLALQQVYIDAEAEHRRWEGILGRRLAVPDDQHRLGQLSGGVPSTARTASR